MKFKDIYEFAVKKGMENDPRSKPEIKKTLAEVRKEFNKLTARMKAAFDRERLKHPYDDTRMLYGDPDMDIRTMMVGIDMEAPELLLADRLNERGGGIDLVMTHHPEGRALAGFHNVMGMQVDMLTKLGISHEVGKDLMQERISEVARSVSAVNHMRSVDVARSLDIPYMCMHTPADNHVTNYLQKLMNNRKPKTLKNVIDILDAIPEYYSAARKNSGPYIMIGKGKNKAGKIAVDMTGGTEGSRRVFPRLSQAGINTIIGMHLSEQHFKSAKIEHINVIIAGHISSDNLGLNLLLDGLLKKENMTIIPCSGFVRAERG
ncbi:MAG: NGG1p interacting factor NIF3 [Candidatus Omnitrophica bacterium]|nr:NGG1p interacting factor NIF3 [Candidatus Omnitrophota bacterium]